MLLHTAPDGTSTLPPMPEPTPAAGMHGATDPDYTAEEIHAVVTVRIAATRDMLAAALDLATPGRWDESPDEWSVQYIRECVEMSLAYENALQLERDSERYPELLDDPSIADRIRATYRAVDRAFPRQAPKEEA